MLLLAVGKQRLDLIIESTEVTNSDNVVWNIPG